MTQPYSAVLPPFVFLGHHPYCAVLPPNAFLRVPHIVVIAISLS